MNNNVQPSAQIHDFRPIPKIRQEGEGIVITDKDYDEIYIDQFEIRALAQKLLEIDSMWKWK